MLASDSLSSSVQYIFLIMKALVFCFLFTRLLYLMLKLERVPTECEEDMGES